MDTNGVLLFVDGGPKSNTNAPKMQYNYIINIIPMTSYIYYLMYYLRTLNEIQRKVSGHFLLTGHYLILFWIEGCVWLGFEWFVISFRYADIYTKRSANDHDVLFDTVRGLVVLVSMDL